jgi:site-specific DNA recombinase
MTIRAAILARVSTDGQDVETQLRLMRAQIARDGAQLDERHVYVDDGVSGKTGNLNARRDLLRMIADLKAAPRPWDRLYFFDFDRMARSDDIEEQARILGPLQRAKVDLVTRNGVQPSLSTPVGRLLAHLQLDGAAEWLDKHRDRMREGKIAAANKGRKPQGQTPYGLGYDRVDKTWSIDEDRAAVVREIFERVLAGEPCSSIAASLSARGILTPRKKAKPWTGRSVWQIVSSKVYYGLWLFNGTTIRVPAIIDQSTWQAAQAQLMKAMRRGLKRTSHVYLLDEGHGRCGMDGCGAPMRMHWGGKGSQIAYYVCGRRKYDKACALPWWPVRDADALVWSEVRLMLSRPDVVERAVREKAQDEDTAVADVSGFEQQLVRLASVREVLMAQFRRGRIDEAELDREMDAIDRERRMVGDSLAAARSEAERASVAIAEIGTLRAYLAELAEAADAAEHDPDMRRRVVRLFAPSVTLFKENIKIGFRLRRPVPIALAGSTCCSTESQCEISVTVAKSKRGGQLKAA